MSNELGTDLTFHVRGREPVSGRIRNPEAKLGAVATKVASRFGIAGTFECLDHANGEVISPECRLRDLPGSDVALAPELTPAGSAGS